MQQQKIDFYNFIAKAILLIGSLLVFAGFFILAFQIYYYLKNGNWIRIPLFVVLEKLPGENQAFSWLKNPQSWYGLHKIIFGLLDFIPLSLFLIVAGSSITAKMWQDLELLKDSNQEDKE